jgi:hypothetical protein
MVQDQPLGAIVQIVGGLSVAAALLDVFAAVLYARAGAGLINWPVAVWLWRAFRVLSRPLGRRGRQCFLSYCGPCYIVGMLTIWVGLLLLGFTLLAWPGLGRGIQSQDGQTPTDFLTAFYYAGGSITTVGTSHLQPISTFFKILTVIDSLLGISVVTLAVTYFIQVYTALQGRNAMALSVHNSTRETGDAAILLAGMGAGDDFRGSTSEIAEIAAELTAVYEAHHFYSGLIDFRFREPEYSIARVILVALDTAALARTILDDRKHGWLGSSAAIERLQRAGDRLLHEFKSVYLRGGSAPIPTPEQHAAWRQRCADAAAFLRSSGISTTPDTRAASDRYVELRAQWGTLVVAMGRYMDHAANDTDPALPGIRSQEEPPRAVPVRAGTP